MAIHLIFNVHWQLFPDLRIFLRMKNKIYLLIFFISAFSFSQVNDTVAKVDSTKVNQLKEITISAKLNRPGIYQLIIPKKILENETLDKTIRRVDFVTIDNAKNIYFKGVKIKNIYYNNRRITTEEFYKINIEDIRNISIDSNNFNQATGEIESVIKITEKKKTENNIKGSADFSQGFFQKFNYYGLNLSNKQNKLSSRLQISSIVNESENVVYQDVSLNSSDINSTRKLSQPFFSLQNIYDIDENSSIYIKNKYSIVDEDVISNFSDLSKMDYKYVIKNYSLNAGYDKKIKNNYMFKLSFDYINFNNSLNSKLNTNNKEDFSNQKFNEITFSPFIQKKEKKYEIINSFVITNRKYNFQNTNNSNVINQNIATYFVNLSLIINEKNSLIVGSRYQFEKNSITNHSSNYFLPNLTYLTKVDSITDLEFSYKRKVQRPSINSISDSNYLDNNGNEIINPEFLLTQIDNVYSFDLYREFKKFNMDINLSYSFSKDYLSTLYGFDNDNLTNTGINVDSYREACIRTSLAIPLWSESKLNINYSFTKLEFKEDLNKIEGLVNYYDISFSGALFKNYLYTINSFYINRFYEYNAFYKTKPDFSFSISKNYLKDKLNLNLEFRNILNQESNRDISFIQIPNYFYQDSRKQSRLLLVSLTYNFGKDFKMPRKYIQNTNSDMKLK